MAHFSPTTALAAPATLKSVYFSGTRDGAPDYTLTRRVDCSGERIVYTVDDAHHDATWELAFSLDVGKLKKHAGAGTVLEAPVPVKCDTTFIFDKAGGGHYTIELPADGGKELREMSEGSVWSLEVTVPPLDRSSLKALLRDLLRFRSLQIV